MYPTNATFAPFPHPSQSRSNTTSHSSVLPISLTLGFLNNCCARFTNFNAIFCISFLRWNYGSSQFEPIRLLATAFPTASVLFTSQSLLLVCDEIFEVDLKDFSVDGMD
jgi:hypothetical protein